MAVFGRPRGELIGVIALQLSKEPINIIMGGRAGMGKTGEIYLVGKHEGITEYRNDRSIKEGNLGKERTDQYIEAALQGKIGSALKVGSTGNMELVSYAPLDINGLKWAVIGTITLEEVNTPLRKLSKIMLTFGACLTLTVILIAIFTSRAIVRPVEHIKNSALALGQGDYDINIDVDSQDEIGVLANTFKQMASNLRNDKLALEREKKYNELLMQSIGEGIYGVDMEGKTTFMNPAGAAMVGWKVEEILGKHQHNIFHHSHADGTHYPVEKCPIYSALHNGKVHFIDNEIFWRKDGTSFFVEYTSTPIREDTVIRGAVVVFRDITERKLAQETSLRESESRLTVHKLMGTALSSMSFVQQLETLLDIIFSVPWFSLNQKGCIFLVNPETGDLEMKAQRGLRQNILDTCRRVPQGTCLCGKAAQNGEVLFASRLDEQHEIHYEHMADHGHYCVPIKSGGNTTGLINLYVNVNHERRVEEDDFLQSVAITIAGLIERRSLEDRVKQQAEIDELTGLPNRALFQERLAHAIGHANRTKSEVVLMFIDLDRFKAVNDALGHKAGDMLLKGVSQRITACVRSSDTVARLGGDEFTVIMPKLTHLFYVEFVVRRILEELAKPFVLSEGVADISGSIGISIFPNDASDLEQLLKNADTAMYHAKQAGRSTFKFFEDEMTAKAMKRLEIEKALKQALQNNEFVVYYQPKVDPTSSQTVGMEALVRWQRPNFGLVPPNEFIPVAEQTGLIAPIGAHILKMACRQNKAWIDAGRTPMCVSVNLSARQFQQEDELLSTIKRTLEETGLPPEYLELEITESMMMDDVEEAITLLEKIKELGVKISVDDFGTGYSSLSSLKDLPIQTLKIDRSFINGLTDDQDSQAIVSAILSLAKQLNLSVVAEGVETKKQEKFLKRLGCDEIQGFFYSKPLPAEEFEKFLDKQRVT